MCYTVVGPKSGRFYNNILVYLVRESQMCVDIFSVLFRYHLSCIILVSHSGGISAQRDCPVNGAMKLMTSDGNFFIIII